MSDGLAILDQVFDCIIIGGGTAGCIAANRVSEDVRVSVLLIEAGRDIHPDAVPRHVNDGFPSSTNDPTLFWEGLQAQFFDDHRYQPYAQSRVMGGGSNINGMMALCGLRADFDAWEEAGARGWSSGDIRPFLDRLRFTSDRGGGPASRFLLSTIDEQLWPSWVGGLKAAAGKGHQART